MSISFILTLWVIVCIIDVIICDANAFWELVHSFVWSSLFVCLLNEINVTIIIYNDMKKLELGASKLSIECGLCINMLDTKEVYWWENDHDGRKTNCQHYIKNIKTNVISKCWYRNKRLLSCALSDQFWQKGIKYALK